MVVATRIGVYSDPAGPAREPAYRRREEFGPEGEIPLSLAGREVARLAVRDLLPRLGG